MLLFAAAILLVQGGSGGRDRPDLRAGSRASRRATPSIPPP